MADSALLVMDVQRDIVAVADGGSGCLPRLGRAIDGVRAAGIPVIYVVIGLRPGDPEVGSRNKVMAGIVRAGLFAEGEPGTGIHGDVAPRQGDVVVTKRRGSAFSGSDLDLVLRGPRQSRPDRYRDQRGGPVHSVAPLCGALSTWTSVSRSWRTPAWTPTPRCTGSSSRGCFRSGRRS